MLTSKTLVILALAGASGATLAAAAEDSPPASRIFVEKAAQDGMAEVEVGKAALQKSQNAQVREFAQRMVKDHGKANQELTAIAKRKGIDVPKKLDAEHAAMVKKLEAQEGDAFDIEYSNHMKMDHTKAIS